MLDAQLLLRRFTRRLLRSALRGGSTPPGVSCTEPLMIRFGRVEIDEAAREVRVAGEVRHLQPQAFDVLWFLATRRDRVVPKAEIFDEVWSVPFVTESALSTRIKEIRRAVGDDGRTQGVIKSVRGIGYRFVATVEEAPPSAPAATAWVRPRLRLNPRLVERVPGQRVAYATAGSGPPLLFMPGWVSSLDAFADGTDPRSAMVARLAEDFSVTIFDRYGTGLSAAPQLDVSLEGSVAEVRAVLGVIDGGPITVFASSAAGPAAVLASAGHSRVAAMVFLCTYANGPALFGSAAAHAHVPGLVRESWGTGSRILADMIVPGIGAVTRSAFARLQRRTATPEVAAGYLEQLYGADATAALPRIDRPVQRVPTVLAVVASLAALLLLADDLRLRQELAEREAARGERAPTEAPLAAVPRQARRPAPPPVARAGIVDDPGAAPEGPSAAVDPEELEAEIEARVQQQLQERRERWASQRQSEMYDAMDAFAEEEALDSATRNLLADAIEESRERMRQVMQAHRDAVPEAGQLDRAALRADLQAVREATRARIVELLGEDGAQRFSDRMRAGGLGRVGPDRR